MAWLSNTGWGEVGGGACTPVHTHRCFCTGHVRTIWAARPLHILVGIAARRARCGRGVAGESFARRSAGTAADLLRWRLRGVLGGVRTLGCRNLGGPGRTSKAGWRRALAGRWQCACTGPGSWLPRRLRRCAGRGCMRVHTLARRRGAGTNEPSRPDGCGRSGTRLIDRAAPRCALGIGGCGVIGRRALRRLNARRQRATRRSGACCGAGQRASVEVEVAAMADDRVRIRHDAGLVHIPRMKHMR